MSPQGRFGRTKGDTVTDEELAVAELMRSLAAARESRLTDIRKNAADWRTGLAGLLTLITAALVFKPPDDITVYPREMQITLGLLAISAAVCGALGLWFLLSAAHGSPKRITKDDLINAGGTEAGWNEHLLNRAKTSFDRGRFLTVVSAALAGTLIYVAWNTGKEQSSPPAYIQVTESAVPAGGTEITRCGELKEANSKGVIYEVSGGQETRAVPADKLLSIVLVESC